MVCVNYVYVCVYMYDACVCVCIAQLFFSNPHTILSVVVINYNIFSQFS